MIYQMTRTDCVRFLVIYAVFASGFVQGLHHFCISVSCCSRAFSYGDYKVTRLTRFSYSANYFLANAQHLLAAAWALSADPAIGKLTTLPKGAETRSLGAPS